MTPEDFEKLVEELCMSYITHKEGRLADRLALMSAIRSLCAERDALQARVEEAEKLCETRARQLAAMTKWLDENQADVWRRGIWDVLNTAVAKEQPR